MQFARVDLSTTPPTVDVPRRYNATTEFIDRHATGAAAGKTAVIDDRGRYTYGELGERVNRAGNGLRGLGLRQESRVLMCMLDTVDFPAVFWGAIKAGLVPIPVNTLLTAKDYDFMLRDSRAQTLVVSQSLYEQFAPIVASQPYLEHIVISGGDAGEHATLAELCAGAAPTLEAAQTTCDDVAFWLYTSGSTGTPKGSIHLHRDPVTTAALYGNGILGMESDDVVFSAAKLFFAYGLGNGMSFPFYASATAVLLAGRPTPDTIMDVLAREQPSIYFGVPTLYGAILANPDNGRANGSQKLRRCVSAGEALPEHIGKQWEERFGVEILDGLGSTEMLHIFLSNQVGRVRYGTSGIPVPGYELRVVAEDGSNAAPGEIGELWVKGGSAAPAYWNQREKTLATFHGPWTRTGDKYTVDADGYYTYAGRTDDMLKVSGQWVSPFEVESALLAHEQVLEAAVVGAVDDQQLVKPKAFVVLQEGAAGSDELAQTLKDFVKDRLAPFKYPRWIEFANELPKTATGKIQRFKLRA
ncbi:MAG: benzoate-CoA ligase family protein [Gammaproteobacteria bacterium]